MTAESIFNSPFFSPEFRKWLMTADLEDSSPSTSHTREPHSMPAKEMVAQYIIDRLEAEGVKGFTIYSQID